MIPKRLRRQKSGKDQYLLAGRSTRDSKEIEAGSMDAAKYTAVSRSTRDSKEIEAALARKSAKH